MLAEVKHAVLQREGHARRRRAQSAPAWQPRVAAKPCWKPLSAAPSVMHMWCRHTTTRSWTGIRAPQCSGQRPIGCAHTAPRMHICLPHDYNLQNACETGYFQALWVSSTCKKPCAGVAGRVQVCDNARCTCRRLGSSWGSGMRDLLTKQCSRAGFTVCRQRGSAMRAV